MARVSAEGKAEAARWLALGKSADWVASRFGVHVATVRGWRRNDPVFKAAYEQQLGGLRGQGVLAIAEQRQKPAPIRRKPGQTTLEALAAVELEAGRKEARRGR